ncbi:nuclear transport factor 2 family protein [Rufibacter immobilis]|uniref:nuclear transport factor 2 family protein n=1 Tax=Rufibacter immobilis TaxID=1348778 RepID=UPI0035EEE942
MKISRENVFHTETVLVEAIKSRDVKLLDNILHDDLLFIAPNGQVVTKQMDLDSHRAGEMLVEQSCQPLKK